MGDPVTAKAKLEVVDGEFGKKELQEFFVRILCAETFSKKGFRENFLKGRKNVAIQFLRTYTLDIC